MNLMRFLLTLSKNWIRESFFWRLSVVRDQQFIATNILISRPSVPLPLSELRIYSQNGEDGVMWEIVNRLYGKDFLGSFTEIGANGFQSNLLFLAKVGWRGTFIDAGKKQAKQLRARFYGRRDIKIEEILIDKHNVKKYFNPEDKINIISIDIDGMEYYILEQILPNLNCDLVICEFNSSPGMEDYLQADNSAKWNRSRYFGAGINIFDHLFEKFNYKRLYIESSGTNAFYIKSNLLLHFNDRDSIYSKQCNYYGFLMSHPEKLRIFKN